MTANVAMPAGIVRYAHMRACEKAQREALRKAGQEKLEKAKEKAKKEEENSGTWTYWMSQKRKAILADKTMREDNPLYVWAKYAWPYQKHWDTETKPGYVILTLKDAFGKTIKERVVLNDDSGYKAAEAFCGLIERTKDRYHEACLALIREFTQEKGNVDS